MKRNLPFLFSVFFIFTCSQLFSQSININTAKEIAKNQLLTIRNNNLKSADLNPIKFQFSEVSVKVENMDTLYFILNDTINKSFVIVSADMRAWPILGYSSERNYSEKNQPASFINLMENRKQEIAYIISNNLKPDSTISATWSNLISTTNSVTETSSVEPLIQTTWSQGCYYNGFCPTDENGPCNHVVTGCTATSMAQVIKYWNYPVNGTGSHSYTHPTYGTLSADFSSTTYQWSQMPKNLTDNNDAVATLMYHCGVSVDMDYGPDGSGGGQPRNALVNYFKYSSNAKYVDKDKYSYNEWINLLKFELNSSRPIWYDGFNYSYTTGHAFVCDGYQNSDYFHINWGWGGYEDGYFYLGGLNPAGYDFNSHQAAIINIFPNSLPDAIGPITGYTEVCQGQTSVNYSVTAIPNAASYKWTLPVGATGTSTTNSINVSFGLNAQSGTIKVIAQNNLGNSPESSLTITANQKPGSAGLITGNKVVCAGLSETYSISPVSGTTNYLWELPVGWTGSSTSTSITVVTGSNSGTISVKPFNSNCYGTASTLNVITGDPVSPSGATASQTTIIAGESTTLSIIGGVLNAAPDWIWYTSNCGGTQVGTGATLSVSPSTPTTYYVQASACGISTICKSVTINVCAEDLSAGNINGNKIVCPDVSEVYSISPVSGAISYTWELPSGWSGSSTTNSITVIPGSIGGTITVRANSTNCSGLKSYFSLTTGVPVSPSSASASLTSIIAGQSTTLRVNGGLLNSAPEWVWYSGTCGGIPEGTGATLSVSPTTSTTYWVQATGCGISTTCRSVTVYVCSAPTAPLSSSASISLRSPANGLKHYIDFAVQAVSGVDGYSWEYSWDGINWQINWYQNIGTSLYWLIGDKPNVPVYLRVRTYKCEPKQYSNYTYNTPQPLYSACDDPASPTVNEATGNSLNVKLNAETPVANPSITTYSIYCTTTYQYVQFDGTLENTEVFQTKSEWGTKIVRGLSSGKQYCFYAKARNNDGDIRYNDLNSACGTTLNISTLSALFSATPTNDCNPLIVNFKDESIGNPTSWAWDIDNDGTVDYITKSPIHSYNNAGTYSVKLTVSNASTSDSKTLTNYITVNPTVSPDVNISASSTTINAGQSVSFTANPTNGGTNPTYEWKVDGVIAGSNTATYSSSGLTNGQVVSCVMTSNIPCASPKLVTSNSISITVIPVCIVPAITSHPAIQNKTAPESAGFSVTASGSNNLYQWQYNTGSGWTDVPNSSPYSGGTTANLSISSTSLNMNNNQYRCFVSSSCTTSAVTSNSVTLSVVEACTPVSVTINPSGQTVIEGSKATFSVSVNGTAPFLYFWYLNGFQILNANSASYTTPTLTNSDNGNYYYCLVTNCGSTYQARSHDATLSVNSGTGPILLVTHPVTPVATLFMVGLKFNVPVSNVLNSITIANGKLENVTGSGDTYSLTVSAKEQTTVSIVLSDAIKDLSPFTNKFAGQTLTYTTGDFTSPQLVTCTPSNETTIDNHPTFKLSFNENVIIGSGGNLKIYKVGTSTPVSSIPITSTMITGQEVSVSYAKTQSGLDKNTSYFILVDGSALKDKAGNSFEGIKDDAAWIFKTGLNFATSVDPIINEALNFKVYPNPTTGIINIKGLPENQKTKIEVFTANGKLIMRKITYADEDKINLSKQVTGTYFLVINKQSIKIIKE